MRLDRYKRSGKLSQSNHSKTGHHLKTAPTDWASLKRFAKVLLDPKTWSKNLIQLKMSKIILSILVLCFLAIVSAYGKHFVHRAFWAFCSNFLSFVPLNLVLDAPNNFEASAMPANGKMAQDGGSLKGEHFLLSTLFCYSFSFLPKWLPDQPNLLHAKTAPAILGLLQGLLGG